jgi:hypothetical protein
MRKLKILVLLAISAISAIAFAGIGSASEFESEEFEKAISSTTLVANVLTLTEKKLECGSTKFEGTSTGGSDEALTVHPVYSECKAFGLTSGVSVTTKGCDYRFNANTSSGMGSMSIVDHSGETCSGIVITADPAGTTCTVSLPKQTISNAASYTNNSGKVKVKFTASAIEANVSASTGSCPLTSGVHSGEKGASYSGESELSAAGTNLKWWEANIVAPKFDVLVNPAGTKWNKDQSKQIKVQNETPNKSENWKVRLVTLIPAGANWVDTNLANCTNKAFAGADGKNCEFSVECKITGGKNTLLTVWWEDTAGRKDFSVFGDLECP